MADTLYSVICTDANPRLAWQCELLEHSFHAVGQPGVLVRLVAAQESDRLPRHDRMRVVRTPAANTHPRTGDAYVPYNRLFSFQTWLQEDEPEGTVLVLDPDMVFRSALDLRVAPGRPVAQRWVDFGTGQWLARHLGVDARSLQPLTWPLAIHTADLARLVPRWIERTAEVRRVLERWESDMFGLVLAAADLGLVFSLETTCAWMPWPEAEVSGAPIIHYCQPVRGRDGGTVWTKRDYRPWDDAFDPADAELPYCRDLLAIIRGFARERAGRG